MKMTMHIDEAVLDRIVHTYGFDSKTEAVNFALNELDRKARLRAFLKNGLGFSAEELKASVDPDYDVMAARRVAETPGTGPYGSK